MCREKKSDRCANRRERAKWLCVGCGVAEVLGWRRRVICFSLLLQVAHRLCCACCVTHLFASLIGSSCLVSEETSGGNVGEVTSCLRLVSASSTVVAEPTPQKVERRCSHLTIRRSGRQTERGSTSFLCGLQLWQKISRTATALHGPPMQQKASLPNRKATATKHKKFGNFDSRCRTLRGYSRLSASRTHSLESATFSLGGLLTSGEVAKSTGGTTQMDLQRLDK